MSFGNELNTPVTELTSAVACERFKPLSMQSMLSRRSMVTRAAVGSTSTLAFTGIPSGMSGGKGSWAVSPTTVARGISRSAWIIRSSE